MYQDKPEWIAHQRKRWMRPDAARWWRPDAHRWMTAEAQRALLPESMQAIAQPQFEPVDLVALERARENLLRLRSELLSLRAELKFRQFFRSLKAGFNPGQPRDDHGRWTDAGGSASGESAENDQLTRVADAGFGILVVELPRAVGRDCVYRFGLLSIIVPGPTNFRCQTMIHWSAASHGQLLNDNWPR